MLFTEYGNSKWQVKIQILDNTYIYIYIYIYTHTPYVYMRTPVWCAPV
jgi:hypothetical protein